MALYTGIAFVSAGACLLEICRLVGKSYETKASASMLWRGLHFVAAVILFGYGCMVLFPGKAFQVQYMSIGLPLVGTVVIVAALAYLDHVMGEREPPPGATSSFSFWCCWAWTGYPVAPPSCCRPPLSMMGRRPRTTASAGVAYWCRPAPSPSSPASPASS